MSIFMEHNTNKQRNNEQNTNKDPAQLAVLEPVVVGNPANEQDESGMYVYVNASKASKFPLPSHRLISFSQAFPDYTVFNWFLLYMLFTH